MWMLGWARWWQVYERSVALLAAAVVVWLVWSLRDHPRVSAPEPLPPDPNPTRIVADLDPSAADGKAVSP